MCSKPRSGSAEAPREFKTRASFRRWLAKNHDRSSGEWLLITKKRAPVKGLRYDEAVEEALCFGWIDSLMRSRDEHLFVQRFSPRRPGSGWAESNRRRVARLVSQGAMTDAGLAVVEEAKESGDWERLVPVEQLEIPPELARALGKSRRARRAWDGLSASLRKRYIWWITGAKREETRARRVAETVRQALASISPLRRGR